jgi:hypothetical protein
VYFCLWIETEREYSEAEGDVQSAVVQRCNCGWRQQSMEGNAKVVAERVRKRARCTGHKS